MQGGLSLEAENTAGAKGLGQEHLLYLQNRGEASGQGGRMTEVRQAEGASPRRVLWVKAREHQVS